MALKEVKECLAPFPDESRTTALSLISCLAREMVAGPVSTPRLQELSQALEVIHKGFDGLIPIFMMDTGSERLAFFVDKFPKPGKAIANQ